MGFDLRDSSSPKRKPKKQQSERSVLLSPIWISADDGQKGQLQRPRFNEGQFRDLQKDRCEISHAEYLQKWTNFAF